MTEFREANHTGCQTVNPEAKGERLTTVLQSRGVPGAELFNKAKPKGFNFNAGEDAGCTCPIVGTLKLLYLNYRIQSLPDTR